MHTSRSSRTSHVAATFLKNAAQKVVKAEDKLLDVVAGAVAKATQKVVGPITIEPFELS